MEGAGRKHTDEEIARRRKDIRAVMAAGRWTMAAARQIADKHGVSIQQVSDVDRRIVLKEIRDSMSPEERENSAAMWMLQVEELYAVSMAKGDRSSAAKALALRAKALGLDAPLKVQHSGPNGGPVELHLSDADVDRILSKAVKQADEPEEQEED